MAREDKLFRLYYFPGFRGFAAHVVCSLLLQNGYTPGVHGSVTVASSACNFEAIDYSET